jgi:hypothetical protein
LLFFNCWLDEPFGRGYCDCPTPEAEALLIIVQQKQGFCKPFPYSFGWSEGRLGKTCLYRSGGRRSGAKEGAEKSHVALQTKGPGLKPVDFIDPLPRAKARCYSEKAKARVIQHPLKPDDLCDTYRGLKLAATPKS